MLPQIPLFEIDHLARLQRELCLSFRRLLCDLCDDLDGPYRMEARRRRLPVSYFRLLGERLDLQTFGGWKVVGLIEELNDLVYFLDLAKQLRTERDPSSFATALLDECEEQFYEHGYREELFPHGRPEVAGLPERVRTLCDRLARQVIQESLLLVPAFPCRWVALRGRSRWEVPVDLGANFERATLAGRLPVGLAGCFLCLPPLVLGRLAGCDWQATLTIKPAGLRLRVGDKETPLATCRGEALEWHWPLVRPPMLSLKHVTGTASFTLGPTLVYGRERKPVSVVPSSVALAGRVQRALTTIGLLWPFGASLLALLTAHVIPLRARGVVSFSYRHRPGLSFINLFDRDPLDLIDDLIHENSHHHLNLLLRKYVLYRGDHNQEIFYSPWRRSLRPLRGILHATFTFTMGAILFERLSSSGKGRGEGRAAGGKANLTGQQILRARFRCLEEIDSVRYSLRDLDYAATGLGWMTGAGKSLVDALRRELERVSRRIAPYEAAVLRSRYGPELKRHRKELINARKTYGQSCQRRNKCE